MDKLFLNIPLSVDAGTLSFYIWWTTLLYREGPQMAAVSSLLPVLSAVLIQVKHFYCHKRYCSHLKSCRILMIHSPETTD